MSATSEGSSGVWPGPHAPKSATSVASPRRAPLSKLRDETRGWRVMHTHYRNDHTPVTTRPSSSVLSFVLGAHGLPVCHRSRTFDPGTTDGRHADTVGRRANELVRPEPTRQHFVGPDSGARCAHGPEPHGLSLSRSQSDDRFI